ncbi:MAG: hypothetical protein II132_06360 [Desulfovibrio sp.]|nr:hypothetical protein [Desulfovibrio sp.]
MLRCSMFLTPVAQSLASALARTLLALALLGGAGLALAGPACCAQPSFTTEDFRRLKTSWPEFADAVAERNRHLGKLEQMLSPAEWEELMADVKAWQARRTGEVAALMQGGMSYRDACLKSLLDRVVVLHGYLREGRLGSPSRWLEPGASNLHYLYYRMSSPRYRQASDELNALWKRLRTELPPEEFQPLLEEQRAWLKRTPAAVAELTAQGWTGIEAGIKVSRERTQELASRYGIAGVRGGVRGEGAPRAKRPQPAFRQNPPEPERSAGEGAQGSAGISPFDWMRLQEISSDYADMAREHGRLLRRLRRELAPQDQAALQAEEEAWTASRTAMASRLAQAGASRAEACQRILMDRLVVLQGYADEGRMGRQRHALAPGATNLHHLLYRLESPAYRKASDELEALWRQIKGRLPQAVFKPVLEEQRAWIAANGREVLALMDQGCTNVEACTRVTEARIENLSRRFGVSEASFRIPAGRYGQSSFASRQTASRIQDKPDQEERPRVQAQPWRQAGQAQPGGGKELSWQASRGDEGAAAQPAPRTNNEVDDHDVRMLRLVEEAGQDFAPE